MIVLRKTMETGVAAERERVFELARTYGDALRRSEALQREMSAWVANKAENITPEQMAQMFYAQDDRWQAAFFNVMQAQVMAHYEAIPPAGPGEFLMGPGVPAGETQWFWMARHLDGAGFETLEAMYEHAKSSREQVSS